MAVLAAGQVGVWSLFFGDVHGVDWVVGVIHSLLIMLVVTRFGLVAAASLMLVMALALRFPAVVLDPTHWTAPVLLVPMVVFLALAVHGYRACIGPKPA